MRYRGIARRCVLIVTVLASFLIGFLFKWVGVVVLCWLISLVVSFYCGISFAEKRRAAGTGTERTETK